MNTQITLSLLMLVALNSCTDNKAQKKNAATDFDPEKITFEIEVMEFEPTPEGDLAFYYFSEVKVDNEANIYITDDNEMKIKIFSKTGEKINEMGQKGKGPGEFERFSGLGLDKESGRITVFDNQLYRITEYSKKGELLGNYVAEEVKMHAEFIRDEDRRLLFQGTFEKDNEKAFLGKIMGNEYQMVSEFMPAAEIDDGIEEVIDQVKLINQGMFAEEGSVYFVPQTYSGYIYQYSFVDSLNTYKLNRKIKGSSIEKSYELLSESSDRRPDMINFIGGERISVLFLTQSLGLFSFGDHYFHFIKKEEGDNWIFGVELFDRSWNLLGFKTIREYPVFDEEGGQVNIPWRVQDVDEEGNFYCRTRTDGDWQVIKMNIDTSNL